MSAADHHLTSPFVQTALPLALASALMAGIAQQAGLFQAEAGTAALYEPQVAVIPPRTFQYRADGEFYRGIHPVDAPLTTVVESEPLVIMKYQVTMSDYGACVLDGLCAPAAATAPPNANVPVTGVSYDDAATYARWLSEKTGDYWTLPSDRNLAFAAGTLFPDDASGLDPENTNPALKWRPRRGPSATPPPSRSAISARTNMAWLILPAMSGNGPRPAIDASTSMTTVGSVPLKRSVGSMSPLVRIARPPAHLSGTPEAEAVLSAPRPTISGSGW